jgi:hypothetical protein
VSQEGDEALKRRFLREAPPQWEEYDRVSRELQGVLAFSGTDSLQNSQDDSRLEYKTNGRGTVLRIFGKTKSKGKANPQHDEVYGFNPRYAFELRRKAVEAPWVLTKHLERRTGTDLGRATTRINSYLTCINFGVRCGYTREPLAELVRKPDFRVGSCRKVQKDGEELVEVAFTYSFTEGPKKWRTNLKGKLLFDPRQYWCWRSGDIQVTGDTINGTLKLRGTQSNKGDELPPLSRVWESEGDWVFPMAGVRNRKKLRYEATLSRPAELPADEEFRLSAFGLPEPVGVVWDKPTPTYVWLLAAAGVVGALAFGFRYLARRGHPTAPPAGEK